MKQFKINAEIEFNQFLEQKAEQINLYLENVVFKPYLQKHNSTRLLQAMQYSVFNGGKRLRPILIYATGEALANASLAVKSNTNYQAALNAASSAVELIHCYSLIHDDLPAMDNDDLRRGKPSCHRAFDEATAILAGDALQSLAFEILSDHEINNTSLENQIAMIKALSSAIGFNGMAGGQSLDMNLTLKKEFDLLKNIHQKKTGALIVSCIKLAGFASNCQDNRVLAALNDYAENIGLSFQVQDDLLDVIGETTQLGKTKGKDKKLEKLTFPELLGFERAKEYAYELHTAAINSLKEVFDLQKEGKRLAQISEYFIQRLN